MTKRAYQIRYYSYFDGPNILRAIGFEYAYLDKRSGTWVSNNGLIGPITGYNGDASSHEITRQQAQKWVKEHHPELSVDWL